MKAIIRFCLILFCSTVTFAQRDYGLLLPEGYSVQPPLNNVSNIGFHNPSFLSRFNGISAGLSYQYGSGIENVFGGFRGKSIVNGLPYSAALTYQAGDFHLAAAVSQRYNLNLESKNGIGIYINNPDGTRKPVNISVESDIHDYSLLSSYSIGNLPEGNSLSLGLRFSIGLLNFYSHYDAAIPLPILKSSISSTSFALGADYKFGFNKGSLNIGAYFEKGLDFKGNVKAGNSGGLNSAVLLEASTPDALRLDILLDLQKVQIMAGLSDIYWHGIDIGYRNNLDFNAAASYKASDMLSVYLGASMNNRKNVYANPYYDDQPKNNALFLTLGADLTPGNYTFGFSVSDSHLTSADTRKQTLGRLTLGYQF